MIRLRRSRRVYRGRARCRINPDLTFRSGSYALFLLWQQGKVS